ncbi:MAG TPA: hypothetical protein VF533_00630 [Solirubrobacteraceae bacterium]|jgi:outer membrane protein assembly factor BamE (lipoprotein component of BamABCDE complex)
MSPTRLRHALAAAAAAGLLALSGCATDDAVKKDGKKAGRTIDKKAGKADEKAGKAAGDAADDAGEAVEDVDGN